MNLEQRAQNYNLTFKKFPRVIVDKNWLYGIWVLGQNYKSKNKYYGEYPPAYLKRLHSLFPDAKNVLHLFSGTVEKGLWTNETLFDINPDLNPDVVGDAHKLSSYFKREFDLIVADPPYSKEDAVKYNTSMIGRKKVLEQCYKILEPCGYLCWLDTMLPMYTKREVKYVGTIGIVRSTNHRFRILSIFEKNSKNKRKNIISKIEKYF